MLIIFRVRLYAHQKFKKISRIPAQSTAGVKKTLVFRNSEIIPLPPFVF